MSTKPIITRVEVIRGHHDRVKVWNRGGFAGEITVCKGDGGIIAESLFMPEDTACPPHCVHLVGGVAVFTPPDWEI
jgi:hypothetical protein